MRISYFKSQKPFDFSFHPYDIGSPIGFWKNYDDNHFLLKILEINESEFPEFYYYHLQYSKENNLSTPEDFYREVWRMTGKRIEHFERKDPFSRKHDQYVSNIYKLQQFQNYLNSIDKLNLRPSYIIIAEKEEIIQKQKKEIENFLAELSQHREYEIVQKIRIEDDHLATVMDLIQQIRELELPSGRKLLRSDHKIPYSKMISKYFSHGGKDIPIETARNYFVEKKGDIPSKGTFIKLEQRLFKIVPIKEIKK